jgi:hypothetical protein
MPEQSGIGIARFSTGAIMPKEGSELHKSGNCEGEILLWYS